MNREKLIIDSLTDALLVFSSVLYPKLPEVARDLESILNRHHQFLEEVEKDYTKDKLIGKGPLATLARKLQINLKSKSHYKECFERKDHLTKEDIIALCVEHINVSSTGFTSGGLIHFDSPNKYPLLKDALEDQVEQFKEGISFFNCSYKNVVMVIPTNKKGFPCNHYLKLIFDSKSYNFKISVISFVQIEGEWIEHQYLEVIDQDNFDYYFVSALKKIAEPVTFKQKKSVFLDLMSKWKEVSEKPINLVFHPFLLVVEGDDFSIEETTYDNNGYPSKKHVLWDNLSPTKQMQFIKLLESNIKNEKKKLEKIAK